MSDESPSTDSGPLLELIDVTKTYDAVGGVDGPAVLSGVSLSVAAGESLAVIGPSGCGKSTLLNIIGALVHPTSGTVRFEGEDLYARDDAKLAAFRSQCIGFIFQSHHLLPQCTALENVLIPTLANPNADAEAPNRASDLLDRVGLAERMNHRPGQLSGGECQRVAVVRALINRPRLVLADEPTGSLDQDSADDLGALLADLNSEHGVTLITVTHSLDLAKLMQRGLSLNRGKLEPWSGDE